VPTVHALFRRQVTTINGRNLCRSGFSISAASTMAMLEIAMANVCHPSFCFCNTAGWTICSTLNASVEAASASLGG